MAQEYRMWTKDEEEYLIKSYENMPPEKIAKALNRSIDSINTKTYDLGLKRKLKRKARLWTKAEIDFVKQHWKDMDLIDIAETLNRSAMSIKTKACQLGLTKRQVQEKINRKEHFRKHQPKWREETSCTAVCICSSVIRGQYLEDIAMDLKRPIEQVKEVYERSLHDGTYNYVKHYLESPSTVSVDLDDRYCKLNRR